MTNTPIPVPKPSGKISFYTLAEDLRRAYGNTVGQGDPWLVVARRAVKLVPITLPEPPPEDEAEVAQPGRADP